MGGYQGIRIVAGVDLVLGPLLTLMIFNPRKRAGLIKFDLTVIGLIQFTALAAGCWLVYQERPVVQVLSDDGLYIHSLSEFKDSNTDISLLQSIDSKYPKLVYLDLPADPEESKAIKFMSMFTEGKPPTLRVDLYKSMESLDNKAIERRLQAFEHDPELGCYWVTVESYHNHGKSCFNYKEGAINFTQLDEPLS